MSGMGVNLDEISVAYKQQEVLAGVSHRFTPGAVTAVLGRSGSGKSTLLQVVNGLVRPQRGQVYIGGQRLTPANVLRMRLRMGFVVQHTGLFPHLTVGKNISLTGKITGMNKQQLRQRTLELMHISMLPETYLDKHPHQLSGGEQQRAGLCRALFLEPPVLLMDEPFASLDYVTKQSLYTYLQDLQKRNARTVILVTHDLDEAIRLADEFIWIEKGTIRDKGDKKRLREIRHDYITA